MPAFDVVPQLQSQVIGIDTPGKRPHYLIMMHEKFQIEILRQVETIQYLSMPIAGPTLVHNLGFDIRDEVLRLLLSDGKQILLPFAEIRIVVTDEQKDIFLRREGHFGKVRGSVHLSLVDRLERI